MIPLWVQMGIFIWRLPRELERRPLDQFLREIQGAPRVRSPDVDAGVARIVRLRRRWLRQRLWRGRNTCYTRALVLYRFLDPGGGDLRFHLGTEPARAGQANIHGHAWVTLNGRVLEPLPDSVASRVSSLYVFPLQAGDALRVPPLEGLAKHPAAQA